MTYDEENKVAEIITDMLKEIDEFSAENRQLKMIEISRKPIYSRRKLEDDFSKTEAQLSESIVHIHKILNKYVELASKQSDGFWNAEEETDVRECRAFINRVLGSE